MTVIEQSTSDKSEFYVEHIKKWQQSGVSQEKYCKSVNISYPTFVYWRTKFLSKGKKGLNGTRKKFLPLKPVPSEIAKQPSTSKTQHQQIKITLSNGIQLLFPTSINSTIIGDCIKVIGEAYDNTELSY